MAKPDTIKSVSDLLAAARVAAASATNRTHLRLWCRGHSQSGWKLEPGIYRQPAVKNEKARLLRERHLTQPVRPDHFDQRISRQHAYFTFHVPARPALTIAENRTLKSFIVPATSKATIKAELALLGVNHFTVFGDLDRLAEWLKGAHP